MKRVLVAMSGGVDSSVAAALLKEQGYECVGATMRLHHAHGEEGRCSSERDIYDAAEVCRKLGMPHYVFDCSDSFRQLVIDPFVESYLAGQTPNPCILCNRHLKFELLYRKAEELGCEAIATGHYARIVTAANDRPVLMKPADSKKEQTYVLYSLTALQLSRTLFPLGELSKQQVRETAIAYGFLNADKPESQDICFIPDGDYAAFIENYTGKKAESGAVLDTAGRILGTHKGILRYTVGQRKGLGLALERPMYVVKTDAATNTVTLGTAEEVFSDIVYGEKLNWIGPGIPEGHCTVRARVRYHQAEQTAELYFCGEGRVRLEFSVPQRAVTPGQAVVFYDGDAVLGGAVITGSDSTGIRKNEKITVETSGL